MRVQFLLKIIIYSILVINLTACTNTGEAIYFSNLSSNQYKSIDENIEPIIQKNDLLSITISSLNPQASEIFNDPTSNTTRTTSALNTLTTAPGYLVNQDGYIQLPLLGNIKAAGITKSTLKQNLEKELTRRKLLLEPSVDIRYLNYKISVIGEVQNPSVFTVPNEKITLLEALGLAGDLTIYANRKNVLLIREEQGVKNLIRIDLTTDELFKSPYYTLKSNDIVYVEPNKTKIASAGAFRQWMPIVLSSLTLVVVAIDRLTR